MSSSRSRRARRVGTVVAALLLALQVALAGAAYAAPPPNDDIAGATPVSDAPGSHTFDSTHATRDQVARPCVGNRSVWFGFRATRSQRLRLTTAGSSYDTVLAVFSGRRDRPSPVACVDDSGFDLTSSLRVDVSQGRRYWVAISAYGRTSGGEGVLTVGRTGAPDVDVAVVGARAGGASGRLIVTGEMTCASASSFTTYLRASQRVGSGGVARGYGYGEAVCDATTRTWETVVDSESGWAFAPGPVVVDVEASSWNGFARASTEESSVVTAVEDPHARASR